MSRPPPGRGTAHRRARAEAGQPAGVPQLAQNLAAPGSSVPHSVQCFTAGAIAWPQPMQNLAPAGFDVEQLAQARPAGAGAGAAAAAGAGAGAGACGAGCCSAPPRPPPSPRPAARNAPWVEPPPWAMPWPAPSAISPAAYCPNPPASWEYDVSLASCFSWAASSGDRLMSKLPIRVIA